MRPPNTRWGCPYFFLVILSFLGFILFLLFGTFLAIFNIGVVYAVITALLEKLTVRLGIDRWLTLTAFFITFYGYIFWKMIGFPIYSLGISFITFSEDQWPSGPRGSLNYRLRYFGSCIGIGINILRALIPVTLAFYQFHHAQPVKILIVTAVSGLLSYQLMTLAQRAFIPSILNTPFLSFLIAVFSALTASWLAAPDPSRTDVSIAFAGGVLGLTAGAYSRYRKNILEPSSFSSLETQDARFQQALDQVEEAFPLFAMEAGTARTSSLIAWCGLFTLIVAEWLPTVTDWLSGISGRV